MLLTPGPEGRTRILVKGHGSPLPALPLEGEVTVQLEIVGSAGSNCWQTTFFEAKRNTPLKFVARGP
jgi:hypothetical protein